MPKLNENYLNLKESYLFSEIAHRVNDYTAKNPDKKVIRLGIGDVTRPLSASVIHALHQGVDDMASAETFKGYGPEQGYEFLRNAITKYYESHGIVIDPSAIFISDGAKSDTGSSIPGLCGFQHYVRPQNHIHFRYCRKRLSAYAGQKHPCRSDLYLFSK